jgi:hypothetical protein
MNGFFKSEQGVSRACEKGSARVLGA